MGATALITWETNLVLAFYFSLNLTVFNLTFKERVKKSIVRPFKKIVSH